MVSKDERQVGSQRRCRHGIFFPSPPCSASHALLSSIQSGMPRGHDLSDVIDSPRHHTRAVAAVAPICEESSAESCVYSKCPSPGLEGEGSKCMLGWAPVCAARSTDSSVLSSSVARRRSQLAMNLRGSRVLGDAVQPRGLDLRQRHSEFQSSCRLACLVLQPLQDT